jgi:hypothetical protein
MAVDARRAENRVKLKAVLQGKKRGFSEGSDYPERWESD